MGCVTFCFQCSTERLCLKWERWESSALRLKVSLKHYGIVKFTQISCFSKFYKDTSGFVFAAQGTAVPGRATWRTVWSPGKWRGWTAAIALLWACSHRWSCTLLMLTAQRRRNRNTSQSWVRTKEFVHQQVSGDQQQMSRGFCSTCRGLKCVSSLTVMLICTTKPVMITHRWIIHCPSNYYDKR